MSNSLGKTDASENRKGNQDFPIQLTNLRAIPPPTSTEEIEAVLELHETRIAAVVT